MSHDPAYLWPGHESRAATFENPAAARSAGGREAGGRKGSPSRFLAPGERVTLVDLASPGRVTHMWLTVGRASADLRPTPELLRAQVVEACYDGAGDPSVSVPVPDFFGAVHGVAVPYASRLTAVNEGRGFASRVPMPFRRSIRVDYENRSDEHVLLYYQADVLLGPVPDDVGYLHASFRREETTTIGRDFVVTEGLRGPGRYLGMTGGVRVHDTEHWWGEGEVKIFVDGEDLPTICGTGTEDYLDSAWGLGPFHAPESGAPLVVAAAGAVADARSSQELVGFYRWHVSDPIVFQRELKVTVQQIGSAIFLEGQEDDERSLRGRVTAAGGGWLEDLPPPLLSVGLFERSDDWCATAFVYCAEAQAVPRL